MIFRSGKEWCAPGVAFASRRMPTSPYSRHRLRRAAARADDERAAACPVRHLAAKAVAGFFARFSKAAGTIRLMRPARRG